MNPPRFLKTGDGHRAVHRAGVIDPERTGVPLRTTLKRLHKLKISLGGRLVGERVVADRFPARVSQCERRLAWIDGNVDRTARATLNRTCLHAVFDDDVASR